MRHMHSLVVSLIIIRSTLWRKTIKQLHFLLNESHAYDVMPFGSKNAPTIFSRIVVATFQEYIHKFFGVYLDDHKVYNLLKEHTMNL
jgi:hypothetical protein